MMLQNSCKRTVGSKTTAGSHRLTPAAAVAALAAAMLMLPTAAPARAPMEYTAANATIGPPAAGERRVVMIGDSITLFWPERGADFFHDRARIPRGQSGGETTTAMRARFAADVLALRPAVVPILGGINDIARNKGIVPAATRENLAAMAAAAKAAGIRVIYGSVLPCDRFALYPDSRPAAAVRELDAWLKTEASAHGYLYADYYPALATPEGGLRAEFSKDGIHPNAAGYRAMAKVVEPLLGGGKR